MNCVNCKGKSCRDGIDCAGHNLDPAEILEAYHNPETQRIVQAAAALVDNGRAGTLSRLEEVIEFAAYMEYKTVGLAYCFGLEEEARKFSRHLAARGFSVKAVSCTVTGLTQDRINLASTITAKSCNPIAQAEQLNSENVELTAVIGLCLGHDILFQKYIQGPVTTFAVKDRVFDHCPLKALR